jgi:uncharacterized membrane protein
MNCYSYNEWMTQSKFVQTTTKAARWLVPVAAVLVFFGWLMLTPPGLLGKADGIGYAVCHRIDARSFHLGDRQLPLCARCSGMYLGALLGMVFYAIVSPRRSGGLASKLLYVPLALMVVAFGIDGVNSYLTLMKETFSPAFQQIPTLYYPNNTLRLLTGTGMGLVIATAIFPAFNQTVWADWDPRPTLTGWRSLGILIALALGLDLLVLTESSIILYPAALLSAGMVLSLLTMIYSLFVIMVIKKENQYHSLKEAWLPLVTGFTVAMLQIALIDILRFALTGTWGAFPIG